MAEYFVYVLQSQTLGIKYIGQTWNLEKRIIEHNLGLSKYTKGKGPWKIVYSESFATRSEAMKRERFLKSGQGREQLKQILKAQNTER